VDKNRAQTVIKEIADLKAEISGVGKYDKSDAVLTIFAGAGGDDAEDWAKILFEMYRKFAANRGWEMELVHENRNDHGGFRNVTVDIKGKGAYGI